MTVEEARRILASGQGSDAEIAKAYQVYYGPGGYYSQQESVQRAAEEETHYGGYKSLAAEVMARLGVTYDKLAEMYGEATARTIVEWLEQGVSPKVIRELAPWTGEIHYEYKLPGSDSGNVNLWQVTTTPDGAIESITWKGPGPAPGPVPTAEELYAQHYSKPTPTQVAMSPTYREPYSLQSPGGGGHSTSISEGGTGPGGAITQPGGSSTKQVSTKVDELDKEIIARAGGDGMYTWDEWNWFYEQVTGNLGPTPEDRGYTRNSDGHVYISGASKFNYATWKAHAFPQRFDREEPPGETIFNKLIVYIMKLVRYLISGGRA